MIWVGFQIVARTHVPKLLTLPPSLFGLIIKTRYLNIFTPPSSGNDSGYIGYDLASTAKSR